MISTVLISTQALADYSNDARYQKLDTTMAKKLRIVANKNNKQAPMIIDSKTTLTTIISTGEVFSYIYKLDVLGEDYDSEAFHELKKPELSAMVCSIPEMKIFVENNILLVYRYFDKNGKIFSAINVDPEKDCV